MKKTIGYALAFSAVVAACIYALLWLTSDVVSRRYATLQAARADGLFDRGWMPDILPPSAVNIQVSNNLDLNDSHGGFDFAPREYAAFIARTSSYRPSGAPFVDFEKSVEDKRKKGFEPRLLEDDGSTWVFSCHASRGHCDYTMWYRKR